MEAGFEGKMAGSKRVQVKGRVALKSPLARFTPPGKAEQDCSSAPTDFSFPETAEQEDAMSGNADKTKFSIRVDTQLVELADAYIKEGLQRNRTELIEEALRFYLGFLTAKKAEDYLLQSLSSVMSGTVQDSENRLARMDFKIAVELSKLVHVIAYTHDVDEAALGKLHLKCLEEVRHINGAVAFEDAYKYQKREV